MKKQYLLYFIVFLYCSLSAQNAVDSTELKSNPIIYLEGNFGYTGGNASGFTIGCQINYQNNKDLFTFRYQNQSNLKSDYVAVAFIAFPYIYSDFNIDEYSILYGKRYIDNNESYSFSIGVSNNIKHSKIKENNIVYWQDESYIGIPFEVTIKWFKANKKRFRAYYGLIPIGKPTAFGRSFGFKLYGNVGKSSYIGAGLSLGYGWHKKY
ncbi:hypothetical protein [Mariniflexile sp.]|uniref:hypothetical protein n=1 Tax=Mariniflexile sp. TaxID=1979402 RepID=UPI004047A2F1